MSAGGWLASSRVAGMPCMCHILTPHTRILTCDTILLSRNTGFMRYGKGEQEKFPPRELDGADAFEVVEYEMESVHYCRSLSPNTSS